MPNIVNNRPKQQQGSGFTNLQRYLQANKSNQLGSAVAGGVQQAGQSARGSLQQAGQQFGQEAGAEKQRLGEAGQYVSSTLGGDVKNVTDQDVNKFQNILGAESRGPTGIKNANEVYAKAEEAQGLGQAGRSEAGRFGLLQRFVGGNRPYQLGQQRLDQMLLGQTGQQGLRQARADTKGLTGQAQRQFGAAEAQAQELRGQARQVADAAKQQLGQSVSQYDAAMQQRLADKQAADDALLASFKNVNNAPIELDEATLKQLEEASGGVLKEGANLYGADLSPFLGKNDLYANKQAVQTADDLAKIQAIGRLSGNYLAGQEPGATLQDYISKADLAGQFDANNRFNVSDIGGVQSAIASYANPYRQANLGLDVQQTNTSQTMDHIGGRISLAQDAIEQKEALLAQDPTNAGLKAEIDGLKANLAQDQNTYNTLAASMNAIPTQREDLNRQYNVLRTLKKRV